MAKRKANDVDPEETSMLDGYTDTVRDTITTKLSSVNEKEKADACAMLSALDPRSSGVQTSFLTREFCGSLLYPCLSSTNLNLAMEAANAVKTWLCSACDEESGTLVRKIYALQVTSHLAQAVANAVALLEQPKHFFEISEVDRETIQELVESLLASFMILAENISVCMVQINKSELIRLILAVYEKKQFLKEELLVVAAECLCVVAEENTDFCSAGPYGLRLYSLLYNLPLDWTSNKALPLSIRAVYILSGVHAGPNDSPFEQCLEALCSILSGFNTSNQYSTEVMMASFEALATMMEDVDCHYLSQEDHQRLLAVLELVYRSVSKLTSMERTSETLLSCDRGFGALTNVLLLCLDFVGENILLVIWREATSIWLEYLKGAEEPVITSLLHVLRILQLNLEESARDNVTPDQVQTLVTSALPFNESYQDALLVVLDLLRRKEMPCPAGLDQIINDVFPAISRADPEFQQDLQRALDELVGESLDPLPVRLQSILQQQ